MRRFAIPLLFLAISIGHAQEIVFEMTLGGSKIGEETYTRKPNGEFVSVGSLDVAGTSVRSKLTGKWAGGKLVSWDLVESANKQSGRIVWGAKKLEVYADGKLLKSDKAPVWKTQAFFSNYHLSIASTILAEVQSKGKPDIGVVVLNALRPIDSKFEQSQATVTIDGRSTQVTKLKGSLATTEMELAFIDGECVGMSVPSQQVKFVRRGYGNVFVDPLSSYPELSQPTFNVKRLDRVRTKMRDGVELMADILRPEAEGRYPVILVRTPYGRANSLLSMDMYARRGYVVVSQDVRGRGASGGGWDPFNREIADGKDTLDWLAEQPWSDGNVGMIGGSYLGMVQWSAAVTHHPALKCIIPQVSPPEPTMNVPWDHGAFLLMGNLWWSRVVMDRQANLAGIFDELTNMKSLLTVPLTKVDDGFLQRDIPFYNDWLKRPNRDDWKGAFTTEQVSQVKIPVMHVSGAWDGDGIGTMIHWQALRANGGNQWLVFGPWDHFFNSKTKFGDQDFGPDAVLELDSVYLRFFDTYLKGKSVRFEDQPRVRFFATGSNRWYTGSDWPLPTAKKLTYHLAGERANGAKSKGALGEGGNAKDTIVYDPNKIKIGQDTVEIDQSKVVTTAKLSDFDDSMLLYRTPAFKAPTTLAGPLVANLYVSTTARDATFYVQLFDQAPDGKLWAFAMTGKQRVGFANGKLRPIQPGKIYRIQVEPWLFAREFKPGHRLVVAVRPDLFPAFARNPGTGESDATATKMIKATHTVYKRAPYASSIELWQIPN